MSMSKLHPNINPLRTYAMLRELSFVIPVIIMFAQWRGVTFAQFMAIQSMYSVVMLLANPLISPLADKYGRRTMVIIGSAFWTLGHVIIWLGYGWQSYALAEVLLGIGMAGFLPAAEALLYDSLASVGKEDKHYKALTKQRSVQSYAGAVAMFCGGWMFLLHPMVPAGATVLANLGMLWVGLKLTEAPYAKPVEYPTYRQMWRNAWQSLGNVETRWLVMLPGLISGSTITLFWSAQPTWQAAGLGAGAISLLMTGYFAARGVFAARCPNVLETLGLKASFGLCIGMLAAGFVAVAVLPWWASYPLFMLGSGFSYMLADTLGRDMVHHHVASAIRSTAMGGFQLTGKLMSIASLGLASALQPAIGLPITLLVLAGLSTVLGLGALSRLKT